MSKLKPLASILFTVSLESYIKKQLEEDVFKEIVKKFKKGGKEIATLITREIMNQYDVQVYTHYKVEDDTPLVSVQFFPKRRFMHTKK